MSPKPPTDGGICYNAENDHLTLHVGWCYPAATYHVTPELACPRIYFSGAQDFLSNFFMIPDGLIHGTCTFSSSEHMYQYEKCIRGGLAPEVAKRLFVDKRCSGRSAKTAARRIHLPYNITDPERASLMDGILRLKFSCEPMRRPLMSTKGWQLVEATRDPFWGGGTPKGYNASWLPGHKNTLGILLMRIRDEA